VPGLAHLILPLHRLPPSPGRHLTRWPAAPALVARLAE